MIQRLVLALVAWVPLAIFADSSPDYWGTVQLLAALGFIAAVLPVRWFAVTGSVQVAIHLASIALVPKVWTEMAWYLIALRLGALVIAFTAWRQLGQDRNRDGTSPERAIRVGSVREEYEWMRRNRPDFQMSGQSLLDINGAKFDCLTAQNAAGQECEVFFDISAFFGR